MKQHPRDERGAHAVPLLDLPGGRIRASPSQDWMMQSLPVLYDKPATAYLGFLDLPVANDRTGESTPPGMRASARSYSELT